MNLDEERKQFRYKMDFWATTQDNIALDPERNEHVAVATDSLSSHCIVL
jgi:hypothetical protein